MSVDTLNGKATRRLAFELARRTDVLRDTLDRARDVVSFLVERVESLEGYAKTVQEWRTGTVTPALQALNQKNQQQDAKLAALDARLTELEQP